MSEKEQFSFSLIQDWNEIDLDRQDGGMALIYNIEDETIPEIFIRLQSWDETKKHNIFKDCFAGRKIKVTIETLD